jgi:arylformamidase
VAALIECESDRVSIRIHTRGHPVHIHFVDSPVSLHAEPGNGDLLVLDRVTGSHPAPEHLADQYRGALLEALTRLGARRLGPQHVQRLVLHAHSPEGVRACRHAIDLIHREILGGMVPEITCCPLTNDQTLHLSVSLAAGGTPPSSDEAVYLGYTPAELNVQYSARGAVPDHPEIFRRWRERSTASDVAVEEIAYGESPWERIDLMRPDGPSPALLIFIHGGYWQSMDKFEHRALFEELVRRNVAVALVNYGLCPDVTVATIVEQVRYACTVLLSSRADHGLDPERCLLAGHSVGAQLAAAMLATDWSGMHPQLPSAAFAGAVLASGVYDLLPLVHTAINRPVGMSVEEAVRLSPLHHKPVGTPDLLIAWGERESPEFRRQSAVFAETWRRHGAEVRPWQIAGAHHFSVMESFRDSDGAVVRFILDTLRP